MIWNMATDAPESPSTSSQPISHSSQTNRHYYVAVDRLQYKMVTLMELLGMAGHRPGLPIVVTCSSRDELDAVSSAVSSLPFISLSSLYSDLAEADRASILENFQQATIRWNQTLSDDQSGQNCDSEKDEQKSHMIVATDGCLPLLSSGESPLASHVLINYELPAKKETYLRRMATCLATDGIVINMVVGGEVATLKSIEESINLVIPEMPINIYELL